MFCLRLSGMTVFIHLWTWTFCSCFRCTSCMPNIQLSARSQPALFAQGWPVRACTCTRSALRSQTQILLRDDLRPIFLYCQSLNIPAQSIPSMHCPCLSFCFSQGSSFLVPQSLDGCESGQEITRIALTMCREWPHCSDEAARLQPFRQNRRVA
jgi:hypothetical protein